MMLDVYGSEITPGSVVACGGGSTGLAYGIVQKLNKKHPTVLLVYKDTSVWTHQIAIPPERILMLYLMPHVPVEVARKLEEERYKVLTNDRR